MLARVIDSVMVMVMVMMMGVGSVGEGDGGDGGGKRDGHDDWLRARGSAIGRAVARSMGGVDMGKGRRCESVSSERLASRLLTRESNFREAGFKNESGGRVAMPTAYVSTPLKGDSRGYCGQEGGWTWCEHGVDRQHTSRRR